MSKKRYSIYPSLMDGYMYYQSLEDEEQRLAKKAELIDRINRLPQPPSEAASRGTALNEIVDSLITMRDVKQGMTAKKIEDENGVKQWYATLDGFHFCYDEKLVSDLVYAVMDCMPQVFVKSEIEIPQGVVTLYGYADYIRDGEVIDLKTTSTYEPWKYRSNWQHVIYPYCLLKSGKMEGLNTFTYLAAEINKGRDQVIRANLYEEEYTVEKMDALERKIADFLSYELIPFIEDNRNLITDTKIFQ